MDMPEHILERVCAGLVARNGMLATAESCTGGLIGHWVTSLSGSSRWYTGGVIAYANAVKRDVLGVSEQMLLEHGAVSQAVVETMAEGVAGLLATKYSLAISGVAGPGGGTPQKPVGTVWMAWLCADTLQSRRYVFQGDRHEVKYLAAQQALDNLAAAVS
mgnify:CR=1 FL=1